VVDATIIAAPSSTKNQDSLRAPEMHQTKNGIATLALRRSAMKTHTTGHSEQEFAAFIGIDWADTKHDICLQATEAPDPWGSDAGKEPAGSFAPPRWRSSSGA